MTKVSFRTCQGCRKVCQKSDLIRCTTGADRLRIDVSQKLAGRGFYVHEDLRCVRALMNSLCKSKRRKYDTGQVHRLGIDLEGLIAEQRKEVEKKK